MKARAGAVMAILWLVVSLLLLSTLLCCEDECLVYGENCSASYKEDNYGTTDIYCCEGSCTETFNGNFVCR